MIQLLKQKKWGRKWMEISIASDILLACMFVFSLRKNFLYQTLIIHPSCYLINFHCFNLLIPQ